MIVITVLIASDYDVFVILKEYEWYPLNHLNYALLYAK